jgi:hypothetical protein
MTNITPNHPCSTMQIVHDLLTHELLILCSIYLVRVFWEGLNIPRLMPLLSPVYCRSINHASWSQHDRGHYIKALF